MYIKAKADRYAGTARLLDYAYTCQHIHMHYGKHGPHTYTKPHNIYCAHALYSEKHNIYDTYRREKTRYNVQLQLDIVSLDYQQRKNTLHTPYIYI